MTNNPLFLMDVNSGDIVRRATDDEIRACRASRSGETTVDGTRVCLAVLTRDADGNEVAEVAS